jgi:hypothetical protein
MPTYMLRPISQRNTPIGIPIMVKITSYLNDVRRHYWEAWRKRGKGYEHNKASEVLQGPDEHLSQFYEFVWGRHLYTPFDPKDTEDQQVTNSSFVDQVQDGIMWKLHKLEGFTGMNASQFLQVAIKVFVNQDQEFRWEANKNIKTKVVLFASSPCWTVRWAPTS